VRSKDQFIAFTPAKTFAYTVNVFFSYEYPIRRRLLGETRLEIRLMTQFSDLIHHSELLQNLQRLGIKEPTPVQVQCLPILKNKQDLVAQAATGSGKTLAFALPILSQIKLDQKSAQALVLCPTRELALQVTKEFRRLGSVLPGLHVLTLFGGERSYEQVKALQAGVHVIVATPGRALDLLERDKLDFSGLQWVVLDEADKMIEMGFADSVQILLDQTPKKKNMAFFSATFDETIEKWSQKYQISPHRVQIEVQVLEKPQIECLRFEMGTDEKPGFLMRILNQYPSSTVIVFVNQKSTCAVLAEEFAQRDLQVGILNGDLEPIKRYQELAQFKNGSHRLLIATDVAARGLDIEELDLVINYDFPLDAESFIHRIGRTARAGKQGRAILMHQPKEILKVYELEREANQKFQAPTLGFKNQLGLLPSYKTTFMQTVSISGGRKERLRPGDIVGALTSEPGKIEASDLGKIEIFEHVTFVGVKAELAKRAYEKLKNQKIKGKKFPVRLLR